jgi:hypothetical protein
VELAFQLLVSAVKLRLILDDWTSEENGHSSYTYHRVSEEDWIYIRSLVALLYLFLLWTESLLATMDMTIHEA